MYFFKTKRRAGTGHMKSYPDGTLIVILIEILNDYLVYLALTGNNEPLRVTPSTSSG